MLLKHFISGRSQLSCIVTGVVLTVGNKCCRGCTQASVSYKYIVEKSMDLQRGLVLTLFKLLIMWKVCTRSGALSPISRCTSHFELFGLKLFRISHFQMHKRYTRRIRTRDPMISRRTLSPLDYRSRLLNRRKIFGIYALYLALTLTLTLTLGEGVNYLTLRVQFYANEWN